jgi:hypothetical protein
MWTNNGKWKEIGIVIHKVKSNMMQQCIKIFIIPYLYEAQHVSGKTPPIIRSLKTALVASSFSYVEACWTCSCWTLSPSSNYTSNYLPHMQNQRLLVQF